MSRDFEILLVEDNASDVRLIEEAFRENGIKCNLNIINDGIDALSYLCREGRYGNAARPDIIILDLNLPGKTGIEVLSCVKGSQSLRRIPVMILTTSGLVEDINRCYDLNANCYIVKPLEIDRFMEIVKLIKNFWFDAVRLPVIK